MVFPGVMIALTVIPTMSLTGMGLVVGNGALVKQSFLHWLLDVGLVLVIGGAVMLAKQAAYHRRKALG